MGELCFSHRRQLKGLRIAPAAVAAAGKGLWAMRDFRKGEKLAEYTGILRDMTSDAVGGPYVLQTTKRVGIDAAPRNAGDGCWANDPRGTGKRSN